MTDPIADMLTRLRNANSAYHDTVVMPYSKMKAGIAEILKAEGYIGSWDVQDAEVGKILGPALPADKVTDAVDQMVEVYLRERHAGERFIDTYRRVGMKPFKEKLYAAH